MKTTCVQELGNCSPDFDALNDLIDSIDMLPYLTIALGNYMMTFMIIDSNIMTGLMSYYINFDTEFVT